MSSRYILVFLLLYFSCNNKIENSIDQNNNSIHKELIDLNYAQGFEIIKKNSTTIIEIKTPWPNSTKPYIYEFDNSELPIDRIVVSSTTHLPALELLGVSNALVGFPGTDYVSSKEIRSLIEQKKVREIGRNGDINTEVLIDLNPDLVIGYGVEGASRSFERIEKIGIPVIFNGDWVEESPLGKAEWIKLFGVLFSKEKEADSIFNHIETEYRKAKELVEKIVQPPTILSGALHKDVWYLPSGTSPEGQFLRDANVNYLWKDSKSKGSLALSFEAVFEKAINADIWLSPSYYTSYSSMLEANEHYSQFKAFKDRNIYSFSNTVGDTGGVLYYELGTARPDLVLKDIIKVCYPQLLLDYDPIFFKPLN